MTFGQTAPKFEVASVKLSPPYQPGNTVGVRLDATQFNSSGIPLRNLIYSAYGVPTWTVSGGPTWLDTEAYDISATLPSNTPKEQINAMLLALFAERFKLTTHREMRDYAVYALVLAKEGSRLKASADGKFSIRTGKYHLEIHNVSMAAFVTYLFSAHATDRPVVDMTGLKGVFDVTFDWTPETVEPTDMSSSVFSAIQEQLGLKLELRKSPVEFIVIDRVERPSDNRPQLCARLANSQVAFFARFSRWCGSGWLYSCQPSAISFQRVCAEREDWSAAPYSRGS